eukprot:8622596-Pyramimonas_sp.AAC.1
MQVRELDLAQTHVTDTIARITTIVERSNCVDGLKTAMDGEDYEQAAKYIETFLQLDGPFTNPTLYCPLRRVRRPQMEVVFETHDDIEGSEYQIMCGGGDMIAILFFTATYLEDTVVSTDS